MNYKQTTHEHRQRIRDYEAAKQAAYAEQYAWRQANPIGFRKVRHKEKRAVCDL